MKCPCCGKKNTEPMKPRDARRKQYMTWYQCSKCNVKYGKRGQ